MAAMELIDISSSDDEFGIDDYVDPDTLPASGSSNSRILPSSVVSHDPVLGYGTHSQNVPLLKTISTSNSSSSNFNNHPFSNPLRETNYSNNIWDSNPHSSRADDSQHNLLNGNVGHYQTINSRIGNLFGADYERLSSNQAFRRTLPSSFQPKSINLTNRMGGSHITENYGNIYNPGESSMNGSRGYTRDNSSKRNEEDILMYENRTNRSLPSSIMRGKFVSTMHFAGSSDTAHRFIMPEEKVDELDERQVYQAVMQDLYQPIREADAPTGYLSVPLLRHQKIALAWMLQKETRSAPCLGGILADDQGLGKTVSMIAVIQTQKYNELKSKAEEQEKPKIEALNLDDDDDNGSSALNEENSTQQADDNKLNSEDSSLTRQRFNRSRPVAGTLVVCPASVLRQWARELEDKVSDAHKLSFIMYHGPNRTKDPLELAKHDVVLTTYAIVNLEVPKKPLANEDEADEENGEKHGSSFGFSTNKKKKKTLIMSKKRKRARDGCDGSVIDSDSGPLARVNWSRVILDEAQTIKNHRTQVARACCTLRAKRRWCLSGTPIQNSIDDLFSYFRFLKFEPYSVSYKKFYATIKVEISKDSLKGYKKLQAILRAIMLRRTKGTLITGEPIITLPPKSICLKNIDFSPEERAFYTRLEAESRSRFKAYAAAGTVRQNYATILLLLLRLRQACDHPSLVKGFNSESVGKDSVEMANRLPRDMVVDLLSRLEASHAICCECEDPPEDPVVTMCGHVYCYECVSDHLTGDDNMCHGLSCKEQLGPDVVFSVTTLRNRLSQNLDAGTMRSEFDEKSEILQSEYISSKIKAVLELILSNSEINSSSRKANGEGTSVLHSSMSIEGPIKAIIFSQWTGMLNLVEDALKQHDIRYRRLDGSMSLASRDRAVKDFNCDPEVTVMLMSLKAGNLGLNMVAACQVILLDLWWNPTTEDQAVDRAHRIGQTRPVTVTRLTINDTVEDRILALQEEKRKMVSSAFGEDQPGTSAKRLTVEDLNYLFKVA